MPNPSELYKDHQEFCDRRQNVKCEEKDVIYSLKNNARKEIAKIKIDGGVISSREQRKCDYLLVICEDMAGVLVELKGADISRAITQIGATLTYIQNDLERHQIKTIHARIASTRIKHTDHISHAKRKLEQRLKKDFQGTLKLQKSPFNDSL